jgi:hypothetical protein
MLNNCSRGDPTDICIGEIGRYLLVLSHALGNGKRLLSSGQIVDDLKTRLGELSKRFKSPQIPVDTRDAMNRYLSQVKKDLALFDDHEASPKDLAEKYEWSGKRMYDFLFSHVPPTDFPGISCELQNLKVLVEAYNPSSPLVTLLATWMASSMTLLAQNHNDILSAQEHSHIHIYAGAATKFLDNIGSSSQKKCLKRLDETIRFFKVQEEYANVNRPTSQSLDALKEFNDLVADLCIAIEKSLDQWGDCRCSYSVDHIMSLSEGVGETLYSAGQSLFCEKDKHEVEQAFQKIVEILAHATKSEFWDDFADLTKALDVLMEYCETLLDAELSLCKLSPGRVALADRGGPGNAAKVNDLPVDAGGKVGHGGSGGQGGGAILANSSAMTGEARALAVLVIHPEWTNKKIAEAAGVHEKSLNRYKKFKAAQAAVKEVGKAALLKGHKTSDGDLEAYDEIN